MKAAFFRRHGGPEVMEVGEVPDPVPGPREVLVAVKAVALNHFNLWLRRGMPAMKVPLPHVSGGDVCGVVAGLGPGVRGGIKEGDRVVVNPGLSCGRCVYCLSGEDNLCADYRMVGEQTWGGEAEYLVVPDENVVVVPPGPGPTDAELASLPIVFLTAWYMLVDRARVRVGETVLVLAAGSGVGVAAIQIAKLHGAHVIGVASTDEKIERARALGADEGINYSRGDLPREVKQLTGGRGADVVFEHTGAATFPASIRAAARGGRIVTCGATAGYEPTVNLRHVFWRHLAILGSTLAPKGRLYPILDLVRDGRLKAVVHRVLPLDQIGEGHRLLEAREVFGKVVLSV
jgi:NADPH:quinone reductase-like Zn-dependent oxidoreductase